MRPAWSARRRFSQPNWYKKRRALHRLRRSNSSIAFEYRIMAKRAGFENARLVDVTDEIKKHADQRALMHHPAPNRMQFRPIQSMEPPAGFAGRHRPQIRKPLPAARPAVGSAPAKPAELK